MIPMPRQKPVEKPVEKTACFFVVNQRMLKLSGTL